MTDHGEPWDPGLQNERTTLAWVRSALSLAAVGTLVAKQTGHTESFGVLMVLALLVATLMAATAERRHGRRASELLQGGEVVSPTSIAATAAATATLAAIGLLIVVT